MIEKEGSFATTPSQVRLIESLCDRFEAAWKSGDRPQVEAYLANADVSLRAKLLRELVTLDWEYRIRSGEPPKADHYAPLFSTRPVLLESIEREISATNWKPDRPERLAQYRIIRELGRGGMGVVYEAEHESLGRRVAIKILRAISLTDATARERFRREAQLTARLQHPNIVQIFEVGDHQGQPFLALEYVDGPSLSDRLRQSPQPPREAAALIETLSLAIHYAHTQGIVHRDLKPANVLLATRNAHSHSDAASERTTQSLADYIPKVTDFGLAQPVGEGDLTATGVIVGTPAYMAPEQAWGKSKLHGIGPSADVYALGAILYEILTGRPVFQGITALDALEQVRNQEPVPPMRLQPLVPRDLETICLKCLAKVPSKRYGDAHELAKDLRRFLEGESISARRASTAERIAGWCRRNKSLVAVGIFGLVALISGLALAVNSAFTAQIRREQQLTQQALHESRFQRSRAEQNADEAKRFRAQAEKLSADYALERGLSMLDQGDIARGMLLLGNSLQLAQQTSPELEHVIRFNLSAAFRRLDYRLKSVLEHGGEANAVVFSPNAQQLWTGGRLSPPRQWSPITGESIGEPLAHEGDIRAIAISMDGLRIATASTDKSARLWDIATGMPFGEKLIHKHWVQTVAFSPDGKSVLTGSADGTARLWEASTGKLLNSFLPPGWIQAVAFNPDGLTMAVAAGVRVWLYDVASGKQIGESLTHQGEVWAIAYSPDGRVLLTGSEESTARLWDASTGMMLGFPILHHGPVRTVGFSPDGSLLWTGDATGKVRMWEFPNMAQLETSVQHQSAVYAVAMNAQRTRLATGSADGKVRLWEKLKPRSQGLVLSHERLAYCVAISPDGQTIATGTADNRVRLWNAKTGETIGHPFVHDASILSVTFSPDGKTLLTGSSDKTARLWNVAQRTQQGASMQHADHVYSVAFSPDGKVVATGAKDNTARLWDPVSGAPLSQPLEHTHWVHAVVFSPDSKLLLTGCEDSTARFWDVATAQAIAEPMRHRGPVRSAAFSPDGTRIVTATWDDGTARLWDVATRAPLGTPMPHHNHVLSVEFSPDGKSLATGTWDGTARLWDVATGKPLGPPLVHRRTVRDVMFSPDGTTLWTAAFDRTVRAWDLAQGVTGDVDHVLLWIQVLTGMELDSDGLFRDHDTLVWNERKKILENIDFKFSERGPTEQDTQ